MKQVIHEALHVEHVGESNDLLAQIGSDSLSTVKLSNLIKAKFGRDVSVRTLMAHEGALSAETLVDLIASGSDLSDLQGCSYIYC